MRAVDLDTSRRHRHPYVGVERWQALTSLSKATKSRLLKSHPRDPTMSDVECSFARYSLSDAALSPRRRPDMPAGGVRRCMPEPYWGSTDASDLRLCTLSRSWRGRSAPIVREDVDSWAWSIERWDKRGDTFPDACEALLAASATSDGAFDAEP